MGGDYSRKAIISNISVKGGDYSGEAINQGTAIIRGNTIFIATVAIWKVGQEECWKPFSMKVVTCVIS